MVSNLSIQVFTDKESHVRYAIESGELKAQLDDFDRSTRRGEWDESSIADVLRNTVFPVSHLFSWAALQPVNEEGEHVPAIGRRMFTRGGSSSKKTHKAAHGSSSWCSYKSGSSGGNRSASSASADHGPVRWSSISEQAFSEMPLVSGYKAQAGRAPFYSNYDTVAELLNLVDASVSSKVKVAATLTPENWSHFTRHLAEHAKPESVRENEQGRTFDILLANGVTESIRRRWTTADAIQRMLVVHFCASGASGRDAWKGVYRSIWPGELEAHLEATIDAYLNDYPRLDRTLIELIAPAPDPNAQ